MRNINRLATPLIAVALMTVPMMALAQSSQQGTATQTSTFSNPAQAKAYQDGVEAAKLDTVAHRTIDAKKSHLYVAPPVKKGPEQDAYRTAFTAGYEATAHGAASSGGL